MFDDLYVPTPRSLVIVLFFALIGACWLGYEGIVWLIHHVRFV